MTKIDVSNNPELSVKVQKKAFEDGWEWENVGGKTIDYNNFNYLYFTKTSISYGNNPKSFNNGTGKIEFVAASFWWIGLAYNLTQLQPSQYYIDYGDGYSRAIGEWLYSFGYPHMFDATGAYLLNDTPNLSLIFEMQFRAGFSEVSFFYSKVVVKNNAGTVLSETFEQGTYYNGLPEENKRTYKYFYSTAPLRHILNQGDRIFVNTQ